MGGESATKTITISHPGREPRILTSIEVVDPTGSITVTDVPPGTPVGSGINQLTIDVKFDPEVITGEIAGQVKLVFDSSSDPLVVDVNGPAISPVGDLRVDIANNNVGGQGVDDGAKSVAFGVLRNVGSDDLNVFGIDTDSRNAGQFTLGRSAIHSNSRQPNRDSTRW